jgi:DNA segregation ATPase FtsK/SpoIIIE-like protein
MALSLALHNSPDRLRLLLLDCTTDGPTFEGMETLPHLACPVGQGPVECVLGLRWAQRMLTHRSHATDFEEELTFDEQIDSSEPSDGLADNLGQHPALVILIDGTDRLCAGGHHAGAEALSILNHLLSDGGHYGMHVVAAFERPGPIAGLNATWGARITGRVSSAEVARVVTGVKGSGAQELLGEGDFVVSVNAELIRFQAATISRSELEKAVTLIRSCAHEYASDADQEAVDKALMAPAFPDQPRRDTKPPAPAGRKWNGD